MATYSQKMKCFDNGDAGDTDIYGSYNTDKASNLMIVFEKCNKNKENQTCKPDNVIDEWLEFKYLVVLENEKLFVQDSFNEDSIRKESSIVWFALSPAIRTDYVKKIYLSEL